MSVSCIVISKEAGLLISIDKQINRLTNYCIEKTFSGSPEALDYLHEHTVDILFLDTKVQELYGASIFKSFTKQPKLIFTTCSKKNADSTQQKEVDYLATPFSFESLLKDIQSAIEEIILQMEGSKMQANYLFLKENKKIVKIIPSSILYIESFKDYLTIHTSDKEVRVRLALSDIEEKLNTSHFVRIHKSYIVAIDRIDSFSTTSVELNGVEIPIGRMFRKNATSILNEHYCLTEV